MKRKLTVIGAVLFATLGFTSCLLPGTALVWQQTGTGTVPHVAVIGDSLVVETQWTAALDRTKHVLLDDLTRSCAGVAAGEACGDAAVVDAYIGATTNDLAKVEPFNAPGESVLVVALGTNDAPNNYVPVTEYQANIMALLAQSPATCVVLVNITTLPSGLATVAPPYNAALQSIAGSSSGRVTVADWNAESLPHPEWFYPNNPHLVAAGVVAYRALIEQSIMGCVTSTTTTT